MPYRVDIYELARSEYAEDEDDAAQIADDEYRLNGNLCQTVEISKDEMPEEGGEDE